jgi:hypothetical protein
MSKTSLADKLLSPGFLSELDQILAGHNRKVHSKTKVISRDCSTKTAYERAGCIRLCFAELHQLGFKLKSPTSLKPKHLLALGGYWQQKGVSAKTLHGRFSNLREFCRWIGKPGMVEDISNYCGGREHLVRNTAATSDLSWEGLGIDVQAFLNRARDLDHRLWIMLSLQRNFGLRAKESIEIRPWRAAALGPDFLYITDGTKGGRHRIVPIRSDRQREIVASAKEIVGDSLKAQLRWPNMNWHQAQAHFYHLMRTLGATKEQLGVTAHGLRHGFLQDEFQHYSGVPAPIKPDAPLPETSSAYQQALLATSLEAGHFRESATTMYTGSVGHQLRSTSSTDSSNQPDADNVREEK